MVKPKRKICSNFYCGKTRKHDQIMCPECWEQVPEDVKQEVRRTHAENPSTLRYGEEHQRAVMKAIRSLHSYRRKRFALKVPNNR